MMRIHENRVNTNSRSLAACSDSIRRFAAIAEQRPAETAAGLNACIVSAQVIVAEETPWIEVVVGHNNPQSIPIEIGTQIGELLGVSPPCCAATVST